MSIDLKNVLEDRLYKIWQRSKILMPDCKLHTLSPPLEDLSNAPECLVPYLKVSKTLVFGGYWYEYTGKIITTEWKDCKITGIIIGYQGCTYWDTLVLSVINNESVKVGEVWVLDNDTDWLRCSKSFQEYAEKYTKND